MKRFNIDEFFWFITLLAFLSFLFYLLNTSKITLYVNPKMIKYINFSFLAFVILTINQFNKIFSIKSRRSGSKVFIIFFLTFAIGFYSAYAGVNMSISDNKTINLTNSANRSSINTDYSNVLNDDLNSNGSKKIDSNSENKDNPLKNAAEAGYSKLDEIVFNDTNYSDLLDKINLELPKYKGKKVQITGFVYKEDGFKPNEFVISRLLVTCCTADSQVIGLLSRSEEASKLGKNQWVKVEGIIDSAEYHDKNTNETSTLPVIIIKKLEKIPQPANSYIYQQY